jgi:hypothetical protein
VRSGGIESVARRVKTALASLGHEEAAEVLARLVKKHPELVAEAERLAAAVIAPPARDEIAACVSKRLLGLDIDDLGERAGSRRGGYVEPWTAVGELIDGIVGPYLEAVRRLAGLGRVEEAHEVVIGVLAGLYGCGDVAGHDVLGYVELSDRADEVVRLLETLGIPLPSDVCLDTCPTWRLSR